MISPYDSRSLARLVALAIFVLVAPSLPASAATAIGEVYAVGGSPKASGPGGDRTLGPGSPLFEKDRVVTGYGNAQIIFVDDTKMVIGPNSTLVIDRFLLRGGNRAKKISFDALRGTFRLISGNSDKDAYEIETGNATIGIRGTAFDFSSRMTTVVATFQGYVALSSGGEEVTAGPNCDVVRAAFGNVGAYDGRAAGVLITNNLPYVLDQSMLAPIFRLDVGDCDAKVNLLEKGRRRSDGEQRGGGIGIDRNRDTGGDGGSDPGGGTTDPGGGDPPDPGTISPGGGSGNPPGGSEPPPGPSDPDPGGSPGAGDVDPPDPDGGSGTITGGVLSRGN